MITNIDIFTKRGITPPWEPDGRVARAQGFRRYEADGPGGWRERRAQIAATEPLYGRTEHADPAVGRRKWAEARREWRNALDAGAEWMREHPDAPLPEDVTRALRAFRRRETLLAARGPWVYWLRNALAGDGWLMPRHPALPERGEVVGQLRPDVPAVLGRGWESHHHFFDLEEFRGARARRLHEAKTCERAPKGHPEAIHHPAGDYLPTGHLHYATGELVVPYRNEAGRYIRHRHWDHAKYLYTPGPWAKRLGTSPLMEERGWGGDDLVVVVMEGTLKMCAVVEAGYPAIEFGSVTLWDLDVEPGEPRLDEFGPFQEIEAFAYQHLRGRPVAVVCDSDWHRNEAVADQTSRVVRLLREEGADAVACAPPEGESLGWVHPVTGVEQREKLGVDDWLGPEHGGRRSLLDVVCRVEGRASSLAPDDERLMGGTYRPRRENAVRVLAELGRRAFPDSDRALFQQGEIAKALGLPPRVVGEAFDLACERGLAGRLDASTRHHYRGSVVSSPPLVWIAPEALPTSATPTLDAWLAARVRPKSAPI